MSSGELQIPIRENDQKLDEKMQVETSNKDTVIELDQEDKVMFRELENMMQKESGSNGQGQDSNQVAKIQRVPDVLKAEKECWEKYFTPKAIAIGPIHAHSDSLLLSKELKILWAAKCLSGLDEKEKVFDEIRRTIKSQSTGFDEECFSKYGIKDEHELARTLFLDGCAMLQFIYSFVCDDLKDLKINAAQAISVQKDLFLLENQIPLWVLRIIMDGSKNKQQMKDEHIATMRLLKNLLQENVKKFLQLFRPVNEIKKKKPKNMETAIRMFINMSSMSRAVGPPTERKLTGVHLLDLLHQSLVDHSYSAPSDDFSKCAFNCLRSFENLSVSVIFKLSLIVLGFPVCLAVNVLRFLVCLGVNVLRFLVCLAVIIVVVFYYIMCLFVHFLKNGVGSYSTYRTLDFKSLFMIGVRSGGFKSPISRRSFRNVQDLKAAGIELKASKSRCLNEVSFSSGVFGGCLRLSPILVDKSTEGKLLNLIAYEICSDNHCKTTKDGHYRISSYLSFLDSLIDNEQDVKDLRAANILRHRLSSDKEVADLFNNIGPVSVADDDAYGNVNAEIQDYYERKIRIWIAEFRRAHLRSPWTLLALLAAAAALSLSATQTHFTINPPPDKNSTVLCIAGNK